MSLPASIDDSVKRIRDVVEQLRGHLQGARHSAMPESCIRELVAGSLRLMAISSECTRIESDMAAARMTGQAQWKSVPAEDLELHPVNLKAEPQEELTFNPSAFSMATLSEDLRARMLASFDRVADDTFKDEEEGHE
jgi:hypothetical protein